ncbi:DUF3823 domain-containing protein [Pedobacter sp. HMF7647]|uniref:DUF3823 domain-containing protein n=1 Tax=Hufsiella arboris TaxID=2695275 RepID=A0A7K1YEB1_9SPHI|nr:DUF3823 domain-containing protein [Hufsiella arboris]MXV52912.1 DUF3823 domain-containing protein [Hufsiella arboris]
MKRLVSKILLGITLLAGSACTKIDNYDGPNASFEGKLVDATTGGNFQTSTGSVRVRLEQISWSDTPSPQDIPSKFDGTFKDSKLFKGKYRITPIGGAFWPIYEPVEMDINGKSSHDFELTPYVVIKNLTSTLNGNELTLNFNIDAPVTAGMPGVIDVQPYVNTTELVGAGASIYDYSDLMKVTLNKDWAALTDADKNMTLKIPGLLPGRTFYVRVGVRLNDSFKSSNFSEIIEVKVP